jgi:hypothetical protein
MSLFSPSRLIISTNVFPKLLQFPFLYRSLCIIATYSFVYLLFSFAYFTYYFTQFLSFNLLASSYFFFFKEQVLWPVQSSELLTLFYFLAFIYPSILFIFLFLSIYLTFPFLVLSIWLSLSFISNYLYFCRILTMVCFWTLSIVWCL